MGINVGLGVVVMRDIEIYTDGAARGNPGPSASGFLVLDDGRSLIEHSRYNGIATNNAAEYTAIIMALEWSEAHIGNHAGAEMRLFSDSELVVRQLVGSYRVKSAGLRALNERALGLIGHFKALSLHNVPRSNPYVSRVDHNLNILLDSMRGRGDVKPSTAVGLP